MTQHLVGDASSDAVRDGNTSIGCMSMGAATSGLSANFGPWVQPFWADTCAFALKSSLTLAILNCGRHVCLGWANRGAAWSISRLTNGPHRHTGEAVCSLPPSSSSVWSGMRCSKQHSFPLLRATWVHLSRNLHPTKHDVPHTPPGKGSRISASALFVMPRREVQPC